MKKFLALLTIPSFLIACSNNSESSSATGDSTSSSTTSTMATAPADSSSTMSSANTAAPVKDSLMQFKDGKVMISVGGSWSALSAPVTTTNGRTVNPNGEVSKGGKTRKLDEGMMIDKDGQIADKDGKPVDNTGWE